MDFKDTRPIYIQIAALVRERISTGQWPEEERIPSVRELGIELGVNPNTCMRAYELLSSENVITNRRGIGYFVSEGSKARVIDLRRQEFLVERLPELFQQMRTLNISLHEVERAWDQF